MQLDGAVIIASDKLGTFKELFKSSKSTFSDNNLSKYPLGMFVVTGSPNFVKFAKKAMRRIRSSHYLVNDMILDANQPIISWNERILRNLIKSKQNESRNCILASFEDENHCPKLFCVDFDKKSKEFLRDGEIFVCDSNSVSEEHMDHKIQSLKIELSRISTLKRNFKTDVINIISLFMSEYAILSKKTSPNYDIVFISDNKIDARNNIIKLNS
jgi:hypothetical protein